MNRLAAILFYLLMVMLFLPVAQQNFNLVEVGRLYGSVKRVKAPDLNSENWFSEKYQKGTEKFVSQKFGFANWFIRFENQIQYTFYHKAKANGVIIGKQEYLYEKGYIDAYYGRDFIGKKRIRDNYVRLKTVVDTLQKLNIDVLIVFAPGKATFYPEYIPDYLKSERKITNLEYSVKTVDSLGLDYIDMSSWFVKMKDAASYPLYPKTGIHWSYYGLKLAIDTMVSYSRNKFKLNLPDLSWQPIEMKSELQRADHDIELAMNLIFEIPNYPMPVIDPIYGEQNDSTAKSLIIADSYFMQMFKMNLTSELFKDGQFWYYNKKVLPKRSKKGTKVKDLYVTKEILDQDLIILMTTESLLKGDHFRFAKTAYKAIYTPKSLEEYNYNSDINQIIKGIKSSTKWMNLIKEKALKKGVPVDTLIRSEARYFYRQQLKKKMD